MRGSKSLPDVAVVDVCEKLVDFLNEHVADDIDALVACAPPELRREPAFAAALARARTDYQRRLPPAELVVIARSLLGAVADSSRLAPALAAVAEDYRDERQFVLEVLAIGAAVSMVIFAATIRGRTPSRWDVDDRQRNGLARACQGGFLVFLLWSIAICFLSAVNIYNIETR